MKTLFKLLLLLIIPGFAFAQSNYKAGYVLKNNGDTLKGFINYKEWVKSPLSIDFKPGKNDKQSLAFGPGDINGFTITGTDTYISYKGQVSMNSTDVQNASSILDTTKQNASLFIHRIASGKYLTLYEQADDFKERLFIAEQNGQPVELKYATFFDQSGQYVNSNIYKGQLILYQQKYAPDNNALVRKIDRINFNLTDVTSVVNLVNNEKPDRKAQAIRYFAGIDVRSMSSKLYIYNSLGVVKTQGTVSPQINLGFDLFNDPNVQRVIFRAEFSFFYNSPHFSFAPPANINVTPQTYKISSYSFSQYTLAVNPQLIVNIYNKENFKIHLGGGISFYISSYPDSKLIINNINGAAETGVVVEKPYNLQTLWLNFPAQIGTTINNKFEIDFTYTAYRPYTNSGDISVASNSLNLGFKYLFSRK